LQSADQLSELTGLVLVERAHRKRNPLVQLAPPVTE
jgi:hypothetical protein